MKKPIQGPPRTAISNLAVATKMFRPVIVDDSGIEWGGDPGSEPPGYKWNGTFKPRPDLKGDQKPPNEHEMVQLAANAIMEIQDFIKNHEALKAILKSTQEYAAQVEMLVLGEADAGELKPATTLEKLKSMSREHTQMKDVLEKAASSHPEQALKTAQAWVFRNGVVPTILKLQDEGTPSAN